MKLSAQEIAHEVGGTLVGPDVVCDGASIDTRSISPGQLFVPLVDVRDGHDFIDTAVANGAAAYLTSHEPQGGSAIVVEDTGAALTALGHAARTRLAGSVIGITGSVGKTSVKDLTLAAIGHTRLAHASERSFNNELGVPLTLINAPVEADVVIVEMGARGIGHIAELCEIARPNIGIVTAVGAVHTSEFGTIEAVAQAKAELIQSLPDTGQAILNAENEYVRAMRSDAPALTTTYGEGGDLFATNIVMDDELRPSFTLSAVPPPAIELEVALPVHGLHQVNNALAALAAAQAVGVTFEAAIEGLAAAALSPWRMELARTPTGAMIINDAYNANAMSTEAALRSLVALNATRRVAVLGVMAELGDRHDADHRAMAVLCEELGIELISFRESAYGVETTDTFAEVHAQLGEVDAATAVLVKGSRVAGLEALAESLLS